MKRNSVLGIVFEGAFAAALMQSAIGASVSPMPHASLVAESGGGQTNLVVTSPSGEQLLTANYTSAILWDLKTGREIQRFSNTSNSIADAAFAPDGKTIATGPAERGGGASLWEVVSGKEIHRFKASPAIFSVVFSPDGKTLYGGGDDNVVRTWDIASGEEREPFVGHKNRVTRLEVSPSGSLLLSYSDYEAAVRIWDITKHSLVMLIPNCPGQARFSSDGANVYAEALDGSVRVVSLAPGHAIKVLPGHSKFDPGSSFTDNEATGKEPQVAGVTDEVISVAFTPDRRQFLTGGDSNGDTDNVARLWDLAEGRQVRTFSGHRNSIFSVAISPDAQVALTAAADGFKRWDFKSGKELPSPPGFDALQFTRWTRFSRDGAFFLVIGTNIAIFDAKNLSLVRSIEINAPVDLSGIFAEFSASGRYVISNVSGRSPCAVVWEIASGHEVHRYCRDGATPAGDVAMSADESMVAVGAGSPDDPAIELFDKSADKARAILKGHKDATLSMAFDGQGHLVSTGRDKTTRTWDLTTGREVSMRRFVGVDKAYVFATDDPSRPGDLLSLAADNRNFVASSWDLLSGREEARFQGRAFAFAALAISSDGSKLLTRDPSYQFGDDSLTVYDARTGFQVGHLVGHADSTFVATFTSKDQHVITGSFDQTARIWDVASGKELAQLKGGSAPVTSLGMSKDLSHLLVGSGSSAWLWDLDAGKPVGRFDSHEDSVLSVAISPSGNQVAAAGRDVHVWAVDDGRELQHTDFAWKGAGITGLGFSPDGETIFEGDNNSFIRNWQWRANQFLDRIGREHKDEWFGIVSPIGSFAVTGGPGFDARVWNNATGELLSTLHGHSTIVATAVFSDDELEVATAGTDGTARLWETRSGKPLGTYDAGGWLKFVALSHDKRKLLTGGLGKVATLWDTKSMKRLQRFVGHTGPVYAGAFTRDKNIVLTGSDDGTVRFWDTRTGREIAELTGYDQGGWAVAEKGGRFDASFDGAIPLHWLISDDPVRPLPLELLTREFYVPNLLPLLLHCVSAPRIAQCRNAKPGADVATLNRAPPVVQSPIIRAVTNDRVDVDVQVGDGTYTNPTTGVPQSTRPYDLRLFRNGQLVDESPPPSANSQVEDDRDSWRKVSIIEPGTDARVTKSHSGATVVHFKGIKLPHAESGRVEVTFSAYAFNRDRVKSDTSTAKVDAARGRRSKMAYILSIGSNEYGAEGWNLQYAAKDAIGMAEKLTPRLSAAGYQVQSRTLLSIMDKAEATKDKVRLAIADIANRSGPDDLVLVFFSGHGYSDSRGRYFLFPSDSKPFEEPDWHNPSQAALQRLISAEDLTSWLYKVDAADLVFIIDACHAAASVQGEGFRPGPLGSAGLGQLAYDKRMRVLAASQSDQAAREMGGQIGEGVLTYALLHDALDAGQAVNSSGKITLGAWLAYPLRRVPQLFTEIRQHKVNDFGIPVQKDAIPPEMNGKMNANGALQTPALFDFGRAGDEIVLAGR
jgi:WD40 repeat protein